MNPLFTKAMMQIGKQVLKDAAKDAAILFGKVALTNACNYFSQNWTTSDNSKRKIEQKKKQKKIIKICSV